MAACDGVSKMIQRVTGASGGPISISFPTTTIAKTQGTNTTVSAGATGDTVVLAANASRRFAQIQNVSGSTVFIAFGAAATTACLALPTGAVFTIDVSTIGEINRQAVHIFNSTVGALNIQVYEE